MHLGSRLPLRSRPLPRPPSRTSRRPSWRLRRPFPRCQPPPTTNAPTRSRSVTCPHRSTARRSAPRSNRGRAESSCGVQTASSVWYSLRASSAERIALDLAAGGELDATIDVYHAVRSQLESVSCQQTEGHGKASLTFKASKNGLYLIRVAALPELAARELLARSLPADPRDRATGRAAALRRRQRAGRPYPEHQRGVLVHAALGRQLPDQPRQRDPARVRQRRSVRSGHHLLRRSEEEEGGGGGSPAADRLRRLPAVHPRPGRRRALQPRHHPAHLLPGHPALPPAGRSRGSRRNGARADAGQLRPRARVSERTQRERAAPVPHGSHEPSPT